MSKYKLLSVYISRPYWAVKFDGPIISEAYFLYNENSLLNSRLNSFINIVLKEDTYV